MPGQLVAIRSTKAPKIGGGIRSYAARVLRRSGVGRTVWELPTFPSPSGGNAGRILLDVADGGGAGFCRGGDGYVRPNAGRYPTGTDLIGLFHDPIRAIGPDAELSAPTPDDPQALMAVGGCGRNPPPGAHAADFADSAVFIYQSGYPTDDRRLAEKFAARHREAGGVSILLKVDPAPSL